MRTFLQQDLHSTADANYLGIVVEGVSMKTLAAVVVRNGVVRFLSQPDVAFERLLQKYVFVEKPIGVVMENVLVTKEYALC